MTDTVTPHTQPEPAQSAGHHAASGESPAPQPARSAKSAATGPAAPQPKPGAFPPPQDLLADNPILTPEQQLEQLASFIEIHYPDVWEAVMSPGHFDDATERENPGAQRSYQLDTEQAVARLGDLLTHTSQLVLGAALDHSMPGVAFTQAGPDMQVISGRSVLFVPSSFTGRYAIALHGGPGWHGSGAELEIYWRPTVAAIAELSGVAILDIDYRLPRLAWPAADGGAEVLGTAGIVADVRDSVAALRAHLCAQPDQPQPGQPGGESAPLDHCDVLCFGSSTSAALAVAAELGAQRLVLQHPRLIDAAPAAGSLASTAPRVLIQSSTKDTVEADPAEIEKLVESAGAAAVERQEFIGYHVLCTPEQARSAAQAAAQFLAAN